MRIKIINSYYPPTYKTWYEVGQEFEVIGNIIRLGADDYSYNTAYGKVDVDHAEVIS